MRGAPLRSRGTFYHHISSRVSPGGRSGGRSCVQLRRCWGRGRPLSGACKEWEPRALGGCSIPRRRPCPLPACLGAPLGTGGLGSPSRGPREGQQPSLRPQLPHGLRHRRPPRASSSLRIYRQRQKRGDAEQG